MNHGAGDVAVVGLAAEFVGLILAVSVHGTVLFLRDLSAQDSTHVSILAV